MTEEDELREALSEVYERTTLPTLVQYAQQQGSYCCPVGCGGGACEVCPCCCAGWCVMGADDIPANLPDDHADFDQWLVIAAEHNPVAAALLAVLRADHGITS